jgi:hypothetical protein
MQAASSRDSSFYFSPSLAALFRPMMPRKRRRSG